MSGSSNSHGLTDQQSLFCHEYAKSLSAPQAYRSAGYSVSDEAIAASASRLLRSPKIQNFLGPLLSLNAVAVLSELVKIAMANISDVLEMNDSGIQVIPLEKLSDRAKAAIKSIKFRPVTVKGSDGQDVVVNMVSEITMHDKLAALDRLAKKLNVYPASGDLLSLIESMSNHGLLLDGQAEVVRNGIGQIEEGLRAL